MISENMYRKYFSISHRWLFRRQQFQQGEKDIHVYGGFQNPGKMYVMFNLHMVDMLHDFQQRKKRTYLPALGMKFISPYIHI